MAYFDIWYQHPTCFFPPILSSSFRNFYQTFSILKDSICRSDRFYISFRSHLGSVFFFPRASCLTLERAFNETPASEMKLKSIRHVGFDF